MAILLKNKIIHLTLTTNITVSVIVYLHNSHLCPGHEVELLRAERLVTRQTEITNTESLTHLLVPARARAGECVPRCHYRLVTGD